MYSGSAYGLRRAAYRLFPPLESLLGYNRTFRDRWVREQIKGLKPGGRVLDVGAGSCPYRELFAGFEYVSHDFVQLTDEQLHGRTGYGKIDVVSTIEAIPVPDASFDVVICTEVLEHVPDPIRAVEEIGRLMRPGGVLLVTAPQRSGLHQVPYHFYGGYTPFWYEKHLGDNGFTDLRITPVGGLFTAYAEEGQRVALYLLFPDKPLPVLSRVVLFLFGLLLAPWLMLVFPCLGFLFQGLYPADGHRMGNCVRAVKGA